MSAVLNDWRQRGRLSLWRYTPLLPMYAGWHFTADEEGCDNVLELLGDMASLDHPAHRTLSVLDPTPIAADRIFGEHTLRVRHPTKLRLSFDPSFDGARAIVGETAERLSISLGPEALAEWLSAVGDLRSGVADFSIGLASDESDEMARLSFWWWPKAASQKVS